MLRIFQEEEVSKIQMERIGKTLRPSFAHSLIRVLRVIRGCSYPCLVFVSFRVFRGSPSLWFRLRRAVQIRVSSVAPAPCLLRVLRGRFVVTRFRRSHPLRRFASSPLRRAVMVLLFLKTES